jgi:hypothetical protein
VPLFFVRIYLFGGAAAFGPLHHQACTVARSRAHSRGMPLTKQKPATTSRRSVKRYALVAALVCFSGIAEGGEVYSAGGKEVLQQAAQPCEWYRANEWDLDLWGALAFPGNTGRHSVRDFDAAPFFTAHLEASNDRFIDRDNAWSGGVDVKYFFSKYCALGAEGLIVDSNVNAGGAGFGTFTLRFPIRCSRFAPYAWVAGGFIAGGGHHNETYGEFTSLRTLTVQSYDTVANIENEHTQAAGQFGAGLEMRFTSRIGLMSDFAWNVASGPDNNFGLCRFGVTLSY